MKKLKRNAFFLSIMVALIASVTVAYANQAIVISGITLPSMQGEIVGDTGKEKQYFTNQYYDNIGTISSVLAKEESVKVKTTGTSGACEGSNSAYITIGYGKKVGWDGSKNCNSIPGKYDVTLKRASFQVTPAYHTGQWFYNIYE